MGKKKFNIPEDVSTLEGEALAQSIADAQEVLSEFDAENASDEDIAEAEAILAYVGTAEARVAEETAAAEQRAARIEAIKAGAKAPKKEEAPAGKTPEQEAAEAQEAADAVAEAERIAAEAGKEVTPAEKEAVVASVAARAAAASKKADDAPPAPEKPKASLVAAAGIPNIAAGTKFESLLAGAGVIRDALDRLPQGYQKDVYARNAGLMIRLPENELSQNNREFRNDFELLEAASKEARLSGGSLLAAGGWGAPSERSLDFCELESIEGLYQVPEVTVTHGGMQYTKGPDFATVLANSTGFWDMTEATAEAGSELKTSLRPSIPAFVEKRLDAVGVMMEAGLLLREGWPEVIARYENLLLKAHAYKMAMKSLAQVQAIIGAAVSINTGFGNALDFLHVVELVALGERQRLLLSQNQTLEVIAPSWAKAVIRADLAQRSGVDSISVSDAQIDSHFTARKVRVQWIQGYQNMPLSSGVAVTYPDTLEFLMYPAGTFVRGVTDVIKLDTIYDSVNLKKNDYVHLFIEQGVLMANPCGDGRRISIPFFANGRRAGTTDAAATAGQNDNLFNTAVANT